MKKTAAEIFAIQNTKKIVVRDNGKRRVLTMNGLPTRTQQQFKDDVNVNNIMKKYHRTGQLTHLNMRAGKYADISNAQDFFDSVNQITKAQEAFQQLPSHLRKRFGNDPGTMLEFIHNPDNYDEAVKLGIFSPKEPSIDGSIPPQVTQPTLNKPLAPTNDDSNDDKPLAPKSKKHS